MKLCQQNPDNQIFWDYGRRIAIFAYFDYQGMLKDPAHSIQKRNYEEGKGNLKAMINCMKQILQVDFNVETEAKNTIALVEEMIDRYIRYENVRKK